jgi:formylglycine-generating enzyme required for sulfatase activity
MVNAETGSKLRPVYRFGSQPIRSSKETVALFPHLLAAHTGAGFRLPDNMEWELAARWRGDDDTNTVPDYTNPYFTKGDSASGAEESWITLEHVLLYAVTQQDSTSPVKSKLSNALGLYDMSGNMYEFCDGMNDWNTPEVPVIRGGRWGENNLGIAIGQQKTDMSLSHQGPSMGLRVAKFY